jgi:polyhydroxyalkanoate synthesis regulator phasin
MFDAMKKAIHVSLGVAVLTRERVRKTLDRLVEEGKLSSEEAEHLADQMVQDGKREFRGLQERMASLMHKSLMKLDLVSKREFDALKERVEILEKELKRGRTIRARKK